MLKVEPSSPTTVRVSPTLICSLSSPFVKVAPDASEIIAELAVTETSLNAGSDSGNVSPIETSSAPPFTSTRALVGVVVEVVPVPVPAPPVLTSPRPGVIAPPENGSRPGKTPRFDICPSMRDGGASVSTSWLGGTTAPAPGVEGAEPGVGAVEGAAVVGGGALPP